MEERRTLRTRGEVIEEYRREFPREVVRTYVRPLPAAMAPPVSTAAAPETSRKKRRWRGALILLAIALGLTGLIAGGRWLLRTLWMRELDSCFYDVYDADDTPWDRAEDTENQPITIPTAEAGEDVRLLLAETRSEALSAPEVYEKVSGAVVTVAADLGNGKLSIGTGILFREDGYLVTNHHVLSGGKDCTVLLSNGAPYAARFIASDADYDLAVLKIEGSAFPTAEFGDSNALRVGETVYAIGTPLNMEMGGTFTNGIISSVDREMQLTAQTSMPLLQTNAALNTGNSGGPLIDEYGQVVGINFMKMYARSSTVEGLGFAIPSAQVERVVNDLLIYGETQPEPLLGLSVMQLPDQLAEHLWGLRVADVTPGGAADAAGVQIGDYVLALDGTETLSSTDILNARRNYHLGDSMTLTLWREGEILNVTLHLTDAVGGNE